MKIFLARHATPDWSRSDLPYHLLPGPPLTEKGWAEAGALGHFLKQQGVQSLYTSPLERCEHTARIAAEIVGAPVQVVKALEEWQPGEESPDVAARLQGVFEGAVRWAVEFGPVAIVTHGGPIGYFLLHLGMDQSILDSHRIYDHRNPLPPAGVWQVTLQNGSPSRLQLVFRPELSSSPHS